MDTQPLHNSPDRMQATESGNAPQEGNPCGYGVGREKGWVHIHDALSGLRALLAQHFAGTSGQASTAQGVQDSGVTDIVLSADLHQRLPSLHASVESVHRVAEGDAKQLCSSADLHVRGADPLCRLVDGQAFSGKCFDFSETLLCFCGGHVSVLPAPRDVRAAILAADVAERGQFVQDFRNHRGMLAVGFLAGLAANEGRHPIGGASGPWRRVALDDKQDRLLHFRQGCNCRPGQCLAGRWAWCEFRHSGGSSLVGGGLGQCNPAHHSPIHRVLLEHWLTLLIRDAATDQDRVAFLQMRQQGQIGSGQRVTVKPLELAGQRPIHQPGFVAVVVALSRLALLLPHQLENVVCHLERGRGLMAQLSPIAHIGHRLVKGADHFQVEGGIDPHGVGVDHLLRHERPAVATALGGNCGNPRSFDFPDQSLGLIVAEEFTRTVAVFTTGSAVEVVEAESALGVLTDRHVSDGDGGHLRHRLLWLAVHQSGEFFSRQCSENTVSEARRQIVGPLVDRLVGDANRLGGGGDRSTEQFNGF